MTTNNPFLNPDFEIKWSELTADHVVPDMEVALIQGQAALDVIRELPDGTESFANTFLALEEATLVVGGPWGKVGQLTGVNDHPELRKAHLEILPKVSAFFAEIPLDQALYSKLKNFASNPAVADLDPVEKR